MERAHWTDLLFLRHPEAFLAVHEAAWEKGEEQTQDLRRLLERFGVAPGARVLDAPCGVGRHATRLAAMGFRVVGVDLSPAFIERAKDLARPLASGDRATYLVGDLRNLSHEVASLAPFDVALNLWASLGYYGEEGDAHILREYAKLVRPGGLLVLFIVNRDYVVRHFEPQSFEAYGDFVVISQARLDLGASWMRNEWRFFRRGGEDLVHVVTVPVEHRIYSLHELLRLLESSGWHVAGTFGGWKMDPPAADAHALTIVARRQ